MHPCPRATALAIVWIRPGRRIRQALAAPDDGVGVVIINVRGGTPADLTPPPPTLRLRLLPLRGTDMTADTNLEFTRPTPPSRSRALACEKYRQLFGKLERGSPLNILEIALRELSELLSPVGYPPQARAGDRRLCKAARRPAAYRQLGVRGPRASHWSGHRIRCCLQHGARPCAEAAPGSSLI